ncbi:MAG: penicillin-binding protein activator [Deltaproteobacteria bacterium]|nr:penicillin-binding protein activator [Deltaproteobacteria bacterium]MCL5792842.1 penicillin-binding protein activator [Deltaproteobacteria bacterium]
MRYRFLSISLLLVIVYSCAPRIVYEGRMMNVEQVISIVRNKASEHEKKHDLIEAIKLYASIPKIYKDSIYAPYGLFKAGELSMKLKLYNDARGYYNQIITQYSNSRYSYNAMIGSGVIDMIETQYSNAADQFKSAIKRSEGDKKGRAYFLLGEAYYMGDKYRDACNAYAHSMTLFSNKPDIELSRMMIDKIVNAYLSDNDAKQLLKGAYTVYETSLLQLKLARAMLSSNNYMAALKLLNAIIASGIPYPEVMNTAISLKQQIESIVNVDMKHIGCILPLSGEMAPFGEQVLKGIELAIGFSGTNGSGYRLFIGDSKGVPEEAVKQAEELVKKDHVSAIIGPLLNATSQEVAYEMQEYGVPDITINQNSNITKVGSYIFQNSLTSADQARNIVDYSMKVLGINSYAVLYPESNYGESMMRSFVEEVLQNGGSINGLEGYDTTETDYKVQIKKLIGTYYLDLRKADILKLPRDQRSKPPPIIDFKAIFIPDYYEKIAMIAPELLYYDVNNVQLLGGNGWSSEALIKLGGRYVDGSIYVDGFFTQSTDPAVVQFVNKYNSEFSVEPTILSALGYDTANILINAIKDAKTRKDIRNNIMGLKNYNGVTGITTYDGSRVPVKKLYILKVYGNRIIEVGH